MKKMFLLSLISFSLTHCMEKTRSQEEFLEHEYFNHQTNQSSVLLYIFPKYSGTTAHHEKTDISIVTKNQCPFCSSRCFNLIKHIRYSHPEQLDSYLQTEKTIICPITGCSKLIKESNTRRHSMSHKEKPYLCTTENCKKKFKTQEDLDFHQFKFKHELRSFKVTFATQDPVDTALREESIICPVIGCGKKITKSNMWRHRGFHKKKPYLCTIENCKRMFTTQEELDFHLFRIEHEYTSNAATSAYSHDAAAAAPADELREVSNTEINTNKRPHDDTFPLEKSILLAAEKQKRYYTDQADVAPEDWLVFNDISPSLSGETPNFLDLNPENDIFK